MSTRKSLDAQHQGFFVLRNYNTKDFNTSMFAFSFVRSQLFIH